LEQRELSGKILPRMVHVNENMAPTNFPEDPYSFTQKILKTYHVPDSVLGSEVTALKETMTLLS